MSKARVIPITVFVTVRDVREALGCSRSTAYEHLRRAAGRRRGERGMLRVAVHTWESYVRRVFRCSESSSEAGEQRLRNAVEARNLVPGKRKCPRLAGFSGGGAYIPITMPRTKPRTEPRK